MSPNERLRQARRNAKFETAADAARAFGWKESTYNSHENGNRGFPASRAPSYAKAFRVREEWLLFGRGEMMSGEDSARRAEDADRLLAIHQALPDAGSRAELMRLAETILLAAKARQQRTKDGRDPEGQEGP